LSQFCSRIGYVPGSRLGSLITAGGGIVVAWSGT
jgi:hypothetical protein